MDEKLNFPQRFLIAYFVGLLLFWGGLNFIWKTQTGFLNYLFSFLFSLIPLLCGLYGVFLARQWGWFRSLVGRSVFFLALGSFSWGVGSMVWSYHNFFESVAVPYPSLADIGFIIAVVFWIVGIFNLSKPIGAHRGSQHENGKVLLLLVPTLVVAFSYYFLVTVARGGVLFSSPSDSLKLFFDLAYPVGDVVILTISLIVFMLSLNYLGGRYRVNILMLLIGFAMMYFADFTFSYTTTAGTFFNGSFSDLLFTVALSLISFGTLGFKLQNPNQLSWRCWEKKESTKQLN